MASVDSNSFYAKSLNCLEATRNACLAFGLSGLAFSTWWYVTPACLAMPPAKSIIQILNLRSAGLTMGVVAVGASCVGLNQLLHVFLPNKKNPAFGGWDLRENTVQNRVKLLGLMMLTMHALWCFAPSCIPLNLKYAVHVLLATSQTFNVIAYSVIPKKTQKSTAS